MAEPSRRNSGLQTTAEIDRAEAGGVARCRHPVAGADRHRALVDDDQRVVHRLGDAVGRRAHVLQVGLPATP